MPASPTRLASLLGVLLALAASGCFDPRVVPCGVWCGADSECPSGLTCPAGRCVPAGFVGECLAAGGDGGGNPDATPTCNGVAGLELDPLDETVGAWVASDVAYTQDGSGVTFDVGGRVAASWAYDLREGAITAELAPTPMASIVLHVRSPVAGDGVSVVVGPAAVVIKVEDGGVVLEEGTLPNREGRVTVTVRTTADRLHIDATNVDGVTSVVDVARPRWVRSAMIELARALEDPGSARPRLFRLAGEGPGAAVCPAESLRDRFDALDPLTWRWPAGCTPTVGDGALVVPTLSTSGCFVHSQHRFQLTGSHAAIELGPLDPATEVVLRAWRPAEQRSARIAIDVAELEMKITEDVAAINTIDEQRTFEPDTMRWLGLRGEGSTLIWETSPDGVTWTERHRADVDLDLGQLVLGVDGLPAGAGAGSARVHTFGR